MSMAKGFLVVDHVADVRIKAWGEGFADVFSQVAKGMWSVMFGEAQIPAIDRWHIEVTGIDMEDLLIAFLNEQLVLFDTDGLVMAHIEELTIEAGPDGEELRLEAVLCGAPVSQVDANTNVQIKAATFHGLELTPTEAWVTFDV
jgi:SHS2 domain-containing protein